MIGWNSNLGDAMIKSGIEKANEALKNAVKEKNISDIDRYNKELEEAWHAASEDMAKAAQEAQQAQQSSGTQSGPQQGGDNNVDEQ